MAGRGRISLEAIKKLTPKQREAARMVADGMSTKKIQEVLGISGSTLLAWRTRCHQFRTEVHQHQRTQFEDTATRTHALAHASVNCLARIIDDDETPPNVRVNACSVALAHQLRLLEHGLRVRQAEALEARLDELERRQSNIVETEAHSY
ncbi:LuxR C-terminal-related transcriptional regulator [Synechococcus sp. CCY 9618]|uniref:LuxR C-terminal-related transcriptional regulator n=1 Tax=Synechococcus sp. CCY 9618 TaxID=2815602 RepID=UPI001C21D150